jgi:hypothetical protein
MTNSLRKASFFISWATGDKIALSLSVNEAIPFASRLSRWRPTECYGDLLTNAVCVTRRRDLVDWVFVLHFGKELAAGDADEVKPLSGH